MTWKDILHQCFKAACEGIGMGVLFLIAVFLVLWLVGILDVNVSVVATEE